MIHVSVENAETQESQKKVKSFAFHTCTLFTLNHFYTYTFSHFNHLRLHVCVHSSVIEVATVVGYHRQGAGKNHYTVV